MTLVLITGATDGIGKATAQMLAQRGHTLLLHGRSPGKLDTLLETLETEAPGSVTGKYLADFSDLETVAQMAERIASEHPRIDTLINNAGVFRVPNPVAASGHDLRFIVNTFAVDILTRGLLETLGSNGRVVTLSSSAQSEVDEALLRGEIASPRPMDAYAQSKLAVTAWSRGMSITHPEGPAFIAVNPGSMLASKMVKEGFGVAGNDIGIGAAILTRAVEDDAFAQASGRYFDNDAGGWGRAHPDAEDDATARALTTLIQAEADRLR